MTNPDPSREQGLPGHVTTLITAVVVGVLIPVVSMILSVFVTGVGSTAHNIVFVGGMLVVALLLVRSFVLYRRSKAARGPS
jgi:hypothetical protein